MKIDWEKLGSVFAVGERTMMFLENEAEQMLKRDGCLDLLPENEDEWYQLFIGDRWMKAKLAEIQALYNENSSSGSPQTRLMLAGISLL